MKDFIARIIVEIIIVFTDVELFFVRRWKGVKDGLFKLAIWRR